MDKSLNDQALTVLRSFGYYTDVLDRMSAPEIKQLAACHSITKRSDEHNIDDEYAIDRPAATAVMDKFLERMDKGAMKEDTNTPG